MRWQSDKVLVLEIFVVRFVRRDRPKQKSSHRRRDRGVRLLGRDDRIFVIDERIGVRARRVDQGETLIGGVRGPSEAAAASIVSGVGSRNSPE